MAANRIIPKLTSSSLSEIQSLTPDQMESDYHAVLGVILEGVKNVQQVGGFKHIFNYGGNQFTLIVKVPVGLVLGDAEGLDGQCGDPALEANSFTSRILLS